MKSFPSRPISFLALSVLVALVAWIPAAFAQANAKATLTIGQPADGSVFTAPAEVQIQLVAVDPDGDIRRVEFYANGQLIGVSERLTKDAVIPGLPLEHTFLWKAVQKGDYKLSAKATATNGSVVEAPGVVISVFDPTDARMLISQGATWRFLNNGSNPGAQWKTIDFADSAWHSGPAQIGYGDDDEATVSTDGENSPHPISAYFRRKFEASGVSNVAGLALRLVRDDGAVVYLNGQELLRDNMPSGEITPETLAGSNTGEENAFRSFILPATALKEGPNILAVEVHQISATSSDMSFDLQLGAFIRPVIERPVVSITADPAETSEPIPTAIVNAIVLPGKFIVRRTGSTTEALNVYLGYDGTATMGTDYEGLPSVVKIPVGERSASLLVLAKGDNLVEETETVIAKIVPPPTPAILDATVIFNDPYAIDPAASSATVKIRDVNGGGSLPVVGIEATFAETREPSDNVRIAPGRFTLKRTGPGNTSRPLTIYLRFEGTATPGADYTEIERTATFAADASTTTLLVEPLDDQLFEGDETVVARLSDPPAGQIPSYTIDPDKSSARVVIHDNEREPGPATLVINTPTNLQVFPFGMDIQITATAIDPRGYIPRVEFFDRDTRIGVSEITFIRAPDPGTPIQHSFLWSNAVPGEHVLTAVAASSAGNRVVSPPVRITVSPIRESVVSVNAEDPQATEFSPLVDAIDPGLFVITRDGPTNRSELIFFDLGGTATPGADYNAPVSPIIIPAGERSVRIEIVPKSDDVAEKMETVSIRLLPSPIASLLPTYKIDPLHANAAAVIYERGAPEGGQIELALPTSGDVFSEHENIPLVAAAFHPTVKGPVDFYADGILIGSSAIRAESALAAGTLIFHSFVWTNPPPGGHILTAQMNADGHRLVSSEIKITTEGIIEIPTVSIRFIPDTTERAIPNADYAPGWLEIRRTGPTNRLLTVFFKVSGTATPEADYVPLGTNVNLVAGQQAVLLAVQAKDDLIDEENETVVVTLVQTPTTDPAIAYRIDREHASGTVTIFDNDPPATVKIDSPKDGDVFPFGTNIVILATAVDPNGYIPRVEFFDGDTRIGVSEIVFVRAPDPGTPIQHSITWTNPPAGEHVLTAHAVDSQNNRVVSPKVGIRVLRPVEGTVVGVTAADAEATELTGIVLAVDPARFVISREGDLTRSEPVFFALGGTATPGADYEFPGSPIVIPAGERSVSITIVPKSDEIVEKMETISIRLLPSPALSPLPTYKIDPQHKDAAAVIYERRPPQDGQLELALPTSGDVFGRGQSVHLVAAAYHPTITLLAVDFYADGEKIGSSAFVLDTTREGGLFFHSLEWTNPPPGAHVLTARTALPNGPRLVSSEVPIRVEGELDLPLVSIRFVPDRTDRSIPDADFAPGSLEISRTGPTNRALTVSFKVGGTATPESDYAPLGTNVTLEAGQRSLSMIVQAKDDKIHEGDETVVATLVQPPVIAATLVGSGYRIDPDHASATVTIIDNDPAPGPATLKIAQPKSGDIFAFGETIKIVAIAIDPSGYIPRVEFYDGDNRIGVSEIVFVRAPDPGTPIEHSFEWTSARPGEHALRARAVDSQGTRVVSEPVRITVSPVPDRVVLAIEAVDAVATEPSDNSAADTATFVIKRTSGPKNIPVEVVYSINGTAKNGTDYSEISNHLLLPAGAASAEIIIKPRADNQVEGEESVGITLLPPPCIAIFPPPPGCYLVGQPADARIIIRDRTNNENKPPVVKIVKPSNGAVFTLGESVPVQAEASDPDGTVKKLELFAEDTLLGSSDTGALTVTWTPAKAGSYMLRARAVDDKGADASTSIRVLIRDVDTTAFVLRVLPGGYTPGRPLPVKLNAVPPPGTSAYAVEDQPPTGWAVSDISDDGVFDSITGKVKFGPFTDARERSLSYQVTPPTNAVGRYEFTGNSSANGKAFPIGGDSAIEGVSSKHPADQNTDSSINLVELTGYAAAWKNGDSWPTGPVPIPVSYVTRAGFLWKHGEAYLFNPTNGAPPLCWMPVGETARITALFVASAHCERSGPPAPAPGAALTFTISVNPPAGTTSYALEEKIPAAWTVLSISDDGVFDSESSSIRWGLFMDATSRRLTYTVQSPVGVGSISEMGGVVSFDGTVERISGLSRVVSVDGSTQVRLTDCQRDEDGKARLRVAGGAGQLCVLEASSDLLNWIEIGTTFLPDGQVEYKDESAATGPRRYYRLRIR